MEIEQSLNYSTAYRPSECRRKYASKLVSDDSDSIILFSVGDERSQHGLEIDTLVVKVYHFDK